MFSEIVSEVELDQINREVGDFEYKYIIYTSLYGGVDQLIDPDFIDADVLYLCFSDRNDLQSDVWKIIRVKEYYDSRIAAKIWKIFGYQILFNNTGKDVGAMTKEKFLYLSNKSQKWSRDESLRFKINSCWYAFITTIWFKN